MEGWWAGDRFGMFVDHRWVIKSDVSQCAVEEYVAEDGRLGE